MLTTKDLTTGEKLLVARRRERTTQKEEADAYGVSLYEYRRWERDVDTNGVQPAGIGKLLVHEAFFILRRRRGWTMQRVADAISRCKFWLRRMENGEIDVAPLAAFWKTHAK